VTGKRDYYGIPPRRSQVELDAEVVPEIRTGC